MGEWARIVVAAFRVITQLGGGDSCTKPHRWIFLTQCWKERGSVRIHLNVSDTKIEYVHRKQPLGTPKTQTRPYMKPIRMGVHRGKENGNSNKRKWLLKKGGTDQGFSTETGVQEALPKS